MKILPFLPRIFKVIIVFVFTVFSSSSFPITSIASPPPPSILPLLVSYNAAVFAKLINRELPFPLLHLEYCFQLFLCVFSRQTFLPSPPLCYGGLSTYPDSGFFAFIKSMLVELVH